MSELNFSGREQAVYTESVHYHMPAKIHAQTVEVMGEVIVAFSHCRRGKCDLQHVIQKLCDVIITAKQSLWEIAMSQEEALSLNHGQLTRQLIQEIYEEEFSKLINSLGAGFSYGHTPELIQDLFPDEPPQPFFEPEYLKQERQEVNDLDAHNI
jgi:hypothetical protein